MIEALSFMKISHPDWTKYSWAPLILVLFLLGLVPLIELLKEDSSLESFFVLSPFLMFIIYLLVKLQHLYHSRNTTMTIDEDKLCIIFEKSGCSKRFALNEITYKAQDGLQMIYFFDKASSAKLAVYDYVYPNVKFLRKWSKNNLTSK